MKKQPQQSAYQEYEAFLKSINYRPADEIMMDMFIEQDAQLEAKKKKDKEASDWVARHREFLESLNQKPMEDQAMEYWDLAEQIEQKKRTG